MTGGGQSKKTLKRSKQMKASSVGAKAATEQRVGKALPDHRSKAPIARPKPKLRKLNDSEKRARALNKKLREIEALRQREIDGEQLDEQQLAKLEQMGSVLEELEEIMGL